MRDRTGPDRTVIDMSDPEASFPVTPATTVRRVPARASYDRSLAHAILDEGLVAHVGFVSDDQPFVIPMVYGRDGDRLLLHGSVASRVARSLGDDIPVCVTVTHVDGLVLAKSQFHHSLNYRSVVILGRATRLTDDAEIEAALVTLVDHVAPGRAVETRPANRVELRQTAVLALPIEQASIKIRTGGPIDDEADLDAAVWSGVIPLGTAVGQHVPDATSGSIRPSTVVSSWTRPGAGG